MRVHNKVDNNCTVENRKKSHGLLNDVDNKIAGCESPAPQSIHQRSGSCRALLGVLSLHITSKIRILQVSLPQICTLIYLQVT